MTERSIDELGPVDYLVVEFPPDSSTFTGEGAMELLRLHDAGIIPTFHGCMPRARNDICPCVGWRIIRLFDAAYPTGHQSCQKDHFQQEIGDDAIETLVDDFARVPSPLSRPFFQQGGGAMQRGTPPTPTATRSTTWPLRPGAGTR